MAAHAALVRRRERGRAATNREIASFHMLRPRAGLELLSLPLLTGRPFIPQS